jgi:choline monooxygenase
MRTPPDILNPSHYAKIWGAGLQTETLPSWCYTSQEWYRHEVENLFKRSWNLVGHDSRIPSPGDYFVLDLVGHSVVVARGRDGLVRAFANSCRHRGVALLEGEGNCRGGIRCPYHGWTYTADGKLTGAPGMEEARDFDKAQWGLKPVRLEQWAGFMFVQFDQNAIPLKDWLGDMPEHAAPYGIERLKVTRRREYDLKCNWKLYVENFKDVSHTKHVHRNTLYRMEINYSGPMEYVGERGEWYGAFVPHEGSRAILGGVGEGVTGFPPIREFTSGNMRPGSFYPTVFPGTCIGFCIDSAWFLEIYPKGPDRMTLVVNNMFHEETMALPEFAQISDLYYKRMDIAVPEDNVANQNSQAGLESPHALPGRMGHLELGVAHCNQYWAAMVLNRPTNARLGGLVKVV